MNLPHDQAADLAAAPVDGAVSNIFSTAGPEHFVGRTKEMAALKRKLEAHSGQVSIAVLHGSDGAGKTTLALQYAKIRGAELRVVWRIDSRTETTLRADLAELATACCWVRSDSTEAEALQVSLSRLCDESDNVLLIYDDVADAGLVRDYLPESGAARAIVIFESPCAELGDPIELPAWPESVGAEFLVAAYPNGSFAQAKELSARLHGLPLAHILAAAYCKRLRVSFADYRRRLDRALTPPDKGVPSEGAEREMIAGVFAASAREAARIHPAALRLIEYAALLAPGPIPLYVFTEGRLPLTPVVGLRKSQMLSRWANDLWRALLRRPGKAKNRGESAREFFQPISSENLDQAIAALTAFALVARSGCDSEPALVVHRLLHSAVAEFAGDRRKAELIRAMLAVYPQGIDALQWSRARRLDASAMALTRTNAPGASPARETSLLLGKMARYRHHALENCEEARLLFEKSLLFAAASFGREHTATAALLSDFAALLVTVGERDDLDRAREHLTRALAIDEKTLGSEKPAVAVRHSNLALALRALGGADNFRLAKHHLMRALAIDERALGAGHPNLAVRYSNLAALLQDVGGEGNLELARDCLTRALAIDERAFGADHPYVAIRLSSLAAVLKQQGGKNLELARGHLTRALIIEEKAYGSGHAHVCVRLSNLALALRDIGGTENLVLAEAYLNRALAIDKTTFGDVHPEHAKHLSNLALVLMDHGGAENFRRAATLLARAIAIDEIALGTDHPNLAASLWWRGSVLRALGGADNITIAGQELSRAEALLRSRFGSDHPSTRRICAAIDALVAERDSSCR